MDEVIKLRNKIIFYFKNTNEDTLMTEEDEEQYRNTNNCKFCEKNFEPVKGRDHCHLTGNYRVPAHQNYNINQTQKQNSFIPFVMHNFRKYDCHLFFEKLVGKNNDEVKFDFIPKTNEENISVTYGCIDFFNSCRFLSSTLDKLVETLNIEYFEISKNEFSDEWEYLNKN